jgi:hypothetical protein
MRTHAARENGACASQSRTAVYRAIDWLENYISKNPHTDAANEARNIIRELDVVRMRPAVDELIALIGQIAKSDQGLKEIDRAKSRIGQPAQTTREEI